MLRLATVFSVLSSLLLSSAQANPLQVKETDETIQILDGENALITYHKTAVDPPEGADPNYKRSAFLHPLRTPSGREVTSIHAEDHVHHLGIWHAWVKSEWDGYKIDFWNLKKAEGRVRYKATRNTFGGGQSAGFSLVQEHVAFVGKEGEKKETVILLDLLSVEAHREGDTYSISYHSTQENMTEKPLLLPQNRYGGGLAYRGPHSWNKENSTCRTSQGKDRSNGHESRAEWVSYSGPVDGKPVTIALIGNQANHDSPQRVRIWPDNTHNGAPFFNFVPVQETAWEIPAYEVIDLSYRILVSDGELSAQEISAFGNH